MKICFPVQRDEGLNSRVYNHFGSAPVFIIVDTDNETVISINNRDRHHEHGACNPVGALDGQVVDAIVVGGIGRGAIMKLNNAGIRVFQAQAERVKENVKIFKSGSLPEFMPDHTCGGHQHGGKCAH